VIARPAHAAVAEAVDPDLVDQPPQHRVRGAQMGDRLRDVGAGGHGSVQGAVTDSAAPSSAPSARSTEQAMHVNVGVSRRV
jgi:hypothetical protein